MASGSSSTNAIRGLVPCRRKDPQSSNRLNDQTQRRRGSRSSFSTVTLLHGPAHGIEATTSSRSVYMQTSTSACQSHKVSVIALNRELSSRLRACIASTFYGHHRAEQQRCL